MCLILASSGLVQAAATVPGTAQLRLHVIQSSYQVILRLFGIGAVTGALAMIIFAVYSLLAPRIRRYVSALRMRRVRRSHRGLPNRRRSS